MKNKNIPVCPVLFLRVDFDLRIHNVAVKYWKKETTWASSSQAQHKRKLYVLNLASVRNALVIRNRKDTWIK